jgi:polyisoprenoid-binding protein YceI
MPSSNRFRASLVGAAVLLLAVAAPLVASAKLKRTGDASTAFKVAGPAGLTIEGRTSEMTVADDGTTVTLTVPLNNVTTGIALRDQHTKNALEVAKYPTTTLVVARSDLKFPAAEAEASGDARGKMTLHGVTKDVTFHYTAKNAGGTIGAKATRGST